MTRYRLRPPAVGRVVIQALATVRPYRAHPVVAERVVLDELQVLLGADQRARVAGKCDDRQRAEHGVDGAALETELAQVGPVQERSGRPEQLPDRWVTASRGRRPPRSGGRARAADFDVPSTSIRSCCASSFRAMEATVTDMSLMRVTHQMRTMRA